MASSRALLALALAALCAALPRSPAPNSNIATLHTLEQYVPYGARSLDGSPYEIWVALAPPSSPNRNRWVLDIMGGA
jgi:hypothetical protein